MNDGRRVPENCKHPEGGKAIGDRWLGEEWVDWTGETGSGRVEVGKGLFLACAGAGFAALMLGSLLLLYLIEPRLSEMPAPLFHASRVTFWLLFFAAGGWFVSVAVSALTEKRFGLALLRYNKGISLLYVLAAFVGRRAGVSRDRLGGSFIQVSNALIKASGRRTHGQLLILAPRCLSRGLKDRVGAMADRYGCEIFTAGGGEAARQRIAESRPSAVVGIACERDLVSGIRDVYPLLPVLAVPNTRPMGPCKETEVDLDKVEEAVRFFVET